MRNETATAINPNKAYASDEASATLLATASTETGKQTQPTQPQTPPAAEKPAEGSEKPGEKPAAAASDKPAEGSEKPAEKPAAAVPEKYEFKAPEGTEYDPEVLESFSAAAKEAGLTQDAAQKLIEKMAPALSARQADQIQAVHKEWQEGSKADKEFGGEHLPENLGVARKALDTFGTPELRKLLDETGLGNHPEVIRLLYRTGKAISEDKFVSGSPGGKAGVDATNVLYPTMREGAGAK